MNYRLTIVDHAFVLASVLKGLFHWYKEGCK